MALEVGGEKGGVRGWGLGDLGGVFRSKMVRVTFTVFTGEDIGVFLKISSSSSEDFGRL